MGKLKLSFLEEPKKDLVHANLVAILENFGKEICEYGRDSNGDEYFSYTVSSSATSGAITNFSLYIIAGELGFDYKAITVEMGKHTEATIIFYTLFGQKQRFEVDLSEGTTDYESNLTEILSGALFNSFLNYLVDQINLKREKRSRLTIDTR
jgi:hypothetical protein